MNNNQDQQLKERVERLERKMGSSAPSQANAEPNGHYADQPSQSQSQQQKLAQLTEQITNLTKEIGQHKKQIHDLNLKIQEEQLHVNSKQTKLKELTNQYRLFHTLEHNPSAYPLEQANIASLPYGNLPPDIREQLQEIEREENAIHHVHPQPEHIDEDAKEITHFQDINHLPQQEQQQQQQQQASQSTQPNTSMDEDIARQLQEQELENPETPVSSPQRNRRGSSRASSRVIISRGNQQPVIMSWSNMDNDNTSPTGRMVMGNTFSDSIHNRIAHDDNELSHPLSQLFRSNPFMLHGMQNPSRNFQGLNIGPLFFQGMDVEDMDYDRLSQLFPNIPRGASQDTIEQLPTDRYNGTKQKDKDKDQENAQGTEKNLNNENSKCCICLEEFKSGDLIRRLPCLHIYHKEEIDSWLRTNHVCPICRLPIDQPDQFHQGNEST